MSSSVKQFLKKLLDLREGSDEKATIIENVKDDSDFSSARFWTLVCAIVVASVGLNINSIPVVIGAMLISPLMGPIVSIGLALSINDWGLMRRSLRNLLTLIIISIGISTVYFALSPITNAGSELLSRIQPTIFDVLIAIFGGAAGFIGISRARHNNIIPGVAIATAIMPPLCTVGYGLGTLQPTFIFGAFYLFLINCIFICLSSLLVATYLKLPKHDYVDKIYKLKVKRIISVVIIIIVMPAIYLAYTFVDQNNFYLNAERYINTVFTERGDVIIYKNISYHSPNRKITLAFLDDRFSAAQIEEFKARLNDFKLTNTQLEIKQNPNSLNDEEWRVALDTMQNSLTATAAIEARMTAQNNVLMSPQQILTELSALFPEIINVSIGQVESSIPNETIEDTVSSVVFIELAPTARPLSEPDKSTLENWLKKRLQTEQLILNFSDQPDIQEETSTSTTMLPTVE